MANRWHYPRKDVKAARDMPDGEAPMPMPERVPAWPGLPGKPQPSDRSKGTKRVKGHAVSKGI